MMSFLFSKCFVCCLCVCVLMLWRGSGWQAGTWFRFDMQGSSEKSRKRTVMQKILSSQMCPPWKVIRIYMGEDERIVMAENVLNSQALYRMSQIVWVRRDLVLPDSDLRRKNQIIQHLSMAFCILSQYWYSTAVSSSPCGVYISQECSTHLIFWPKRILTTFPDMTHQF